MNKPSFVCWVLFLGIACVMACTSNPGSGPKDLDPAIKDTVVPPTITTVIAPVIKKKDSLNIKVCAYLIYEDSSLSDFDVLNDKTKALWNTIIGAGDAEKPSEKTKLLLTGLADSISLLVKNGSRTVINKKGLTIKDTMAFILRNTGCEEVSVEVRAGKLSVYKGKIEFHCGE